MSNATLDAELCLPTKTVDLAPSSVERNRRSREAAKRCDSEGILWGFDETSERTRFECIQRRLIRLEAALFEEFGARIDSGSRKCLERLFVGCPTVRAPSISSSPQGILTATWKATDGVEVAIRCVSVHAIQYATVSRSSARAGELDRQWGTNNSPHLFFQESPTARAIAE